MRTILFAVFMLFSVSSIYAEPVVSNPQLANKIIKININKADEKVLAHSYKGIGKKRAQSIINYRAKYGNFKSVAELAEVRGIGKLFVKRNLKDLENIFTVS